MQLSLVSYHVVLPQTIHFRFNQQQRECGVNSTLLVFEPLALRLLCPGSKSTTNLMHSRNTIVIFSCSITLIVTHQSAWAQLSCNCVQLPKQLNTARQTRVCVVPFTQVNTKS